MTDPKSGLETGPKTAAPAGADDPAAAAAQSPEQPVNQSPAQPAEQSPNRPADLDRKQPTPMLDGITVLDLASVGPAARASRWLADYGASVVKVGAVPARGAVQITPVYHAYSGHRGMRRVLLDLKAEQGRETFLRLAEHADVVIESFRPGVTGRLGIGYDEVRGRNLGIVYCSTTGFGQDGPHSQWAGHDLDYLAVGGYLAVGEPGADGKPPLPGATLADSAGGGMHAVMAILAAIVRRQVSGEGAYLDVSVADGVLSLMSLAVDEYLATGRVPGHGRSMTSGRYACYDTYPSADGKWVAVAAIEPKFWANLCRLLGLEKWAGHQTDDAVQDQIRADLRHAFAKQDRDAWASELSGSDTCVAPVLSVDELMLDEQFAARDALTEAMHPEHGGFHQVAPLLAGMTRQQGPYQLPDGTHVEAVLTEAGFTADEIAKLREEGVVA